MITLNKFFALGVLSVGAATSASSAVTPDFSVNINLLGGGGSAPLFNQRFFRSSGIASDGTGSANMNLRDEIWFVADKTGDGLNLPGSLVTENIISSWSIASSENVVFRFDEVGGSLSSNGDGRFTRNGISVNSGPGGANATEPNLGLQFEDNRLTSLQGPQPTRVFGILWDDAVGGEIGDQFNIFELTLTAIPSSGNPTWTYSGGIVIADQGFTVVAVPEPSTYALLALGGLGAFAVRRFRRE